MPPPRSASIPGAILFALLYFLAGWSVLLLARSPEPAGGFWLPSGIALLALLVFGWRYWPAIAIGAVGLGWYAGAPFSAVLLVAAGSVGEGLLGYRLLHRATRGPSPRLTPGSLARIAGGVFLAPLVGAALGALGYWLAGTVELEEIGRTVGIGYVGDAVSIIVLLPLITYRRFPIDRREVDGLARGPALEAGRPNAGAEMLGEAIGSAISRSGTLEDGLKRCAEAMAGQLRLDLVRIYVLEPEQDHLVLRASAGIEDPAPPSLDRVRVGDAAVGRVAADRRPYLADTVEEDELIDGREWCAEQGLISFAALPLQVEERLVGVVSALAVTPLDERALQALGSVADAIAVGIERKRFERDLEYNRTLFEAVTEQAGEGIAILDADYRCVLSNSAFCRMLGYERDELLERSVRDLLPSDAELRIAPALLAGESARRVVTLVRKDGSRFAAEVSGYPLEIGEERLGLGIVRDVSRELEAEERQRQVEEQLRLSQRMESVGQLAGGVAHDFNNLLLVIMGHAELATDHAERRLPEILENLAEIQSAAEHAAVLTRQLLAFSRRQALEIEVLDLNELVSGLLRMLRRLIPENYEIEFVPTEELGQIRGDEGQLEQVLLNLVVNARDALAESGRAGCLRITTENATIDEALHRRYPWAMPGDYVLLRVEDSGVGISPDVADRIFDPFFTTKEVGHGTGMGLATVYGIVKQHRGVIFCESEPGAGTSFRIYLPFVDRAVPRGKARLGVGPEIATGTILVAEDEESVRKMVSGILRQAGYLVIEADDGAEALQLFYENRDEIDLVLLDAVMPKLSGLDAYARIAELCPDVRVLFTSGYSPGGIPQELSEDDRFTLLPKPYAPHDLLREVRDAMKAREGAVEESEDPVPS